MASYYVHIPNSEAPTAEVEASSTKHARTAYLDYLSRNSLIGWKDRQAVRTRVIASSMEPGAIQTQVQIEYGVAEPPIKEIEAPPETDIDAGEFAETPAEMEEGAYEASYSPSTPREGTPISPPRTSPTPMSQPQPDVIRRSTSRPVDAFERRLTGEIAKGLREVTERQGEQPTRPQRPPSSNPAADTRIGRLSRGMGRGG